MVYTELIYSDIAWADMNYYFHGAVVALDVGPGVYRFGYAVIKYEDGVLSLSDLYIKREFYVGEGVKLSLVPVKPVHVPKELTGSLYIEIEPALMASKPSEFWVSAPYEILIRVGESPLVYLSPFKVKYILYGDVVEGEICRYHHSSLNTSPPSPGWDSAYFKIRVESVETPIKYIYIPLDKVEIREEEGSISYTDLMINVGDGEAVVKPLTDRKLASIDNLAKIIEDQIGGWRFRL